MKLLLLIIPLIFFFSSCKLIREVKKGSSDSTAVKKETEIIAKVDTSKTTKEKDYERITYIFPKDTTITHNHFYSQKPSVIIQEKGAEREQTQTFNYEAFKKEILDSIGKKETVKEVESKGRIGPSTLEWILIGGIALLFLKGFIPLPSKK